MRRFLVSLSLALALPITASAEQLLESYTAYLSWNDHYNSRGVRLTQPWQIIRQDRANYHRDNAGDPGDDWDSFFGSLANRNKAEQMIMHGSISSSARHSIVNSEVTIDVNIYGYGTTGTRIEVTVR